MEIIKSIIVIIMVIIVVAPGILFLYVFISGFYDMPDEFKPKNIIKSIKDNYRRNIQRAEERKEEEKAREIEIKRREYIGSEGRYIEDRAKAYREFHKYLKMQEDNYKEILKKKEIEKEREANLEKHRAKIKKYKEDGIPPFEHGPDGLIINYHP